MPPRRSSRSRASVEPTPAPEPVAAKRKRGKTDDPETAASKPPSRARRSTSARPSVPPPGTRTSTRSRGSLPDVPEDEDQEEGDSDAPPPVKKARPSLEPQEEEESGAEEEEEVPKSKGRRAASTSRKPSSASRKSGPSSGRSKRPSQPPAPIQEDDEQGEEQEDEEEEEPVKTRKAARRNGKARRVVEEEDEDASMQVLDEEPPPSKGRKPRSGGKSSTSKTSKKISTSRKAPVKLVEEEDEDDEDDVEPAPPPVRAKEPPTATQPPVEDEEEEEEKSLFDPPPMPAPSTLPKNLPEEPSGPKARLVIHQLALVNFKSYAGRQEIGPFHKSFSSIVGPNGSGKSNTIDALLFVFGYRASKMRQGKLSELIHNSARYPDLDECSVEVHFREIIDFPGPDEYEVVPDSELIVSRTAFKNNTSKYTIDGKGAQYKEVQTLLKGRGIDLDHNRFLILQGEVESIAQMKPKASNEHEDGLLEYLEDIIGTSHLKEPIDLAMVEVEKLSDERLVKLNRLRIVEKEKAALEKEKKAAEDYLRLKNEHIRALSRLWQWIIWRCLINEEEYEGKMDKLKKDLADETERNKDDITHFNMLQKHYEEREKAYDEVRAAAEEANKDLAKHEKQQVGLQEREKHAKSKAKKLKKSVQEDTNTRNQALRDIEDHTERIEKKKREAEEKEAELVTEEKVLERIRDSLKDKTQEFHDQIEAKQKELQPWTAKINKKQAEVDVASSERDALQKKAEGAEAARKDAEGTLNGLKTDLEVKAREYEKLRDNKANLQRQIGGAERSVQECQKKIQECRTKAASSRQRVDEAKASQADNRSQGRVLDSLTRLQASGRIGGFHGRLGSLGTIPDKYDVAISTAAPALHNMVVDTVEQGQACIDYLRSQNAGRASFIVLDKLPRSGSGMNKISTPENVPRLFDLIKPKDPKFLPAFYKAVGNTLVADNMDQANRIAFGATRWKVVTLAGQLIDTAGTMSGGGNQPARGAMSSKFAAETVRPEILRGYEEDSQEAAQKLEEATRALRDAEEELERLKASGPQIEMAHQKLGMDIENSRKRIQDAEKRLQEVRSQSKPNVSDASRISTLDDEIASATEDLEKLQAKSSKIEDAIKALEQKILEIGGSKLLTQKSKVDGIKLHINLASDEITKAEVGKAKAEKDVVKLENALKTNSAALEEVDAELAELGEQLRTLNQYVKELQDKVNAAQSAAETSKEDLDSLKAELDEKEQEIEEFRKKEMDIKRKLADIEKEAKDNGEKIEHWQSEHDKLRLEEIDDDDEDEEDENGEPKVPAEQSPEAPEAPADAQVKTEPREPRPPKAKQKESSADLHIYSVEELGKLKKREMVADVELLDENVKNSKPDLSVLKEYRRREEEFLNRAKDLDDITSQRDAKKQEHDMLRKQRLDEFMAGFNLISLKLKEMYQMITLGGNAELELVDSMDPFSEGIIFSVMPPKKSWKNIANLSGGEKTLSSLALVFALHVFKPTPLYFMDEIDAALDFRNVSIVANYIKDRTKNAQFIIISLRNDMFELSHRLIGIYKTSNATRSISIDNHALVAPPTKA